MRQSNDERGLAQRASRVRDFTCRGKVNEHLMVYSFLFERLGIEIPEGATRAPSACSPRRTSASATLIALYSPDLGSLLEADERQARDKLFEEDAYLVDTARWNR